MASSKVPDLIVRIFPYLLLASELTHKENHPWGGFADDIDEGMIGMQSGFEGFLKIDFTFYNYNKYKLLWLHIH